MSIVEDGSDTFIFQSSLDDLCLKRVIAGENSYCSHIFNSLLWFDKEVLFFPGTLYSEYFSKNRSRNCVAECAQFICAFIHLFQERYCIFI